MSAQFLTGRAPLCIFRIFRQTCACWTCTDGHQSIGEFWRPILASFGQEVEQIPDRCKEVYASVVWVAVWARVKRGFGGIKVMDFAIRLAAEHADARMLFSVPFDAEIRVETTLATR